MDNELRVFIIDDDIFFTEAFCSEILKGFGAPELLVSNSLRETIDILEEEEQEFDLCIIDMKFENELFLEGGLAVLEALKRHSPSSICVVYTGHPTEENFRKSIRKRADEYIVKGDHKKTIEILKNLMQEKRKKREQKNAFKYWIINNRDKFYEYEGNYIGVYQEELVAVGRNELELKLNWEKWKRDHDKEDITDEPHAFYYTGKEI